MLLLRGSVSSLEIPAKGFMRRLTVISSIEKSPLTRRPKFVGCKVPGVPKLIGIWVQQSPSIWKESKYMEKYFKES